MSTPQKRPVKADRRPRRRLPRGEPERDHRRRLRGGEDRDAHRVGGLRGRTRCRDVMTPSKPAIGTTNNQDGAAMVGRVGSALPRTTSRWPKAPRIATPRPSTAS